MLGGFEPRAQALGHGRAYRKTSASDALPGFRTIARRSSRSARADCPCFENGGLHTLFSNGPEKLQRRMIATYWAEAYPELSLATGWLRAINSIRHSVFFGLVRGRAWRWLHLEFCLECDWRPFRYCGRSIIPPRCSRSIALNPALILSLITTA